MDSILYGSFFIGAVFCFICGYFACERQYREKLHIVEEVRDSWRTEAQQAEEQIRAYKTASKAQTDVMEDLRTERDALKDELERLKKQHKSLRLAHDKMDRGYAEVAAENYRKTEEITGLKDELDNQKRVNEVLIAESHQYREERDELKAELAKVNDPETRRVVAMRKQMQQDQAAFNLLFNYGQEMAYGQVSPADVMGIKEGKVE